MTLKRLQPGTINSTKLFAFVLIALGIAVFAYQGIGYTITDNVAGPGLGQVTPERKNTLPPPPIASAIAWAGGIVLLLVDGRKRWAVERFRMR